MAARTPGLDWVRALYVQHSGGYEKHGQDMIVEEGTGRTIAVVYDGAFYSERIVEACNGHDSLVSQRDAMREALKLCMESMIDAHDPDFTPCLMHEHGIDDCICQLSVHFRKGVKALALADGAE